MIKKYITVATFIVVLIYASFFFMHYTILQGYLLASAIFTLGIINFFVIHKLKMDFPFVSFTINKTRVKIENYRLAFLGGLLIMIGVTLFFWDKRMPFVYISFGSGIFFSSFASIKLQQQTNEFARIYKDDKELSELLLSPLANTGVLISLLLTHNSWFINEIVPKVLKREQAIQNFNISPADFFDRMDFQLWMDNGSSIPPSARKTVGKIVG